MPRLSKSACHIRSLRIHRNGQDFKILISMSLVKLLPDRQLFSARSPRCPSENEDPATPKVAQTNRPTAVERLNRKVRGRLTQADTHGDFQRKHQNNRGSEK